MRRPGYRESIRWLVLNDDIEFLRDAEPCLSVTASLVADQFGVDDSRVLADLQREAAKERGADWKEGGDARRLKPSFA